MARSSEMSQLCGSIGGNRKWSRLHGEARTEATAAARAAGPGSIEYWESKVDPDQEMTPADRTRCAQAAKREHFARLALASAKARAGKTGRRSPAQTDSGGE